MDNENNKIEIISNKELTPDELNNQLNVIGNSLFRNVARARSGTKKDNENTIEFTTALASLEPIDLTSIEDVKRRTLEYFALMHVAQRKLIVSAYAVCLGISSHQLNEIAKDNPKILTFVPKDCKDVIKKAYHSIEVSHETNMVEGKINPATAIFLAKHHFGYTDVPKEIEVVDTGEDELYNIAEIKDKYK